MNANRTLYGRMLGLAAVLVLPATAQAQQCSGGPDGGMDATGNQCNTPLVLAAAAFGSIADPFKPAPGESLAMIVPAKGVQKRQRAFTTPPTITSSPPSSFSLTRRERS